MTAAASTRLRTFFGIGLAFVVAQLVQQPVAHAAGAKTTKMTAQTAAEIPRQMRETLAIHLKNWNNEFSTSTNEFNVWCADLNAGPECSKWPSLRVQGILFHFAPLLSQLPKAPRDRVLALVKNKASVSQIRTKYFEEAKSYQRNYSSMTQDINNILVPLFTKYGVFVPAHAASNQLRNLIQKYASSGVTVRDLDDTVQLLVSLKLKELITVMYYSSSPDAEGLTLSNAAINKITRDPVTKEIISIAHAFFKSEKGGKFAKGEVEKAAVQRTYARLAQKVPLSHGVWTTKKNFASIENLPSTLSLARGGRVLNAHAIVKLWETVKGFNSEFMGRILEDNRNSTVAQLAQNEDITRIANPSDIGREIDLTFFQPVVAELQQDIYKFAYYQEFLAQLQDPRVEYQFRDFLRDSRGRIGKNVSRIESLEKQFPGIIDRKRFNSHLPRRKAIAQARADVKAAKANAGEPSATSQIAEGGRKLWQWARNLGDFTVGTVVDTVKRQPRGTYSSLLVMRRHEEMLRTYGYSAFGTNTEFIQGSKLALVANQTILAPILSLSGMVGGTMVLLEDGWDTGIRSAYGMSEEQYNRAEKNDAGIKALKVGFYVIQGAAGLAVTVGTGGAAAPAVFTRATIAGLTIRTAASILLKPTFRAGVFMARRSVQPLAMAFGLGAIFSVAQELYESEKEGGEFSLGRVASGTGRGASTTLMFMGGMTTLAKKMAAMNYSQHSIVMTSAAIDVIESSGDVPNTFEMWRESKTPLQYFASGMMLVGNILDSGDSAYTIVRGNKAHGGASAGSHSGVGPQSAQERGAMRIERAIGALGEPLTGRQAQVLRSFLPGTGESVLEARLLKAKMSPQKAKKVAGLYGLWKSEYF